MNSAGRSRARRARPTSLLTMLGIAVAVWGGGAGCDDTAKAVKEEAKEEIQELNQAAEQAEKEAARAAADLERKAAGAKADLERTGEQLQGALADAARQARDKVEALDKRVADEIREEE